MLSINKYKYPARFLAALLIGMAAVSYYVDLTTKTKMIYYARVNAIYFGPVIISFVVLRVAGINKNVSLAISAAITAFLIANIIALKLEILEEYRPVLYLEHLNRPRPVALPPCFGCDGYKPLYD